jgi:3-hydroxybutyrate dehydrogenase
VLTPLVEQQLRDRAQRDGIDLDRAKHDLLSEKQPMLAFSTPEQIGAFAAFLCTEAASTITGAPLSIDGGWTAQ